MIVTAAHCQGAFNYGILILDPTTDDYTRSVPVVQQIRHPRWDYIPDNLNFDVLVLKLETPLRSDDVAKPIPYNTDSAYPVVGDTVTGFGMGLIDNTNYVVADELLEADFKYISNDQCFGRIQFNNVQVGTEIMCTDPIDGTSTCLGDSGGPLTDADANVLLGIISFGAGCTADNIPDGYVRLSAVANWIDEQICLISDDKPTDCPPPPAHDPREVPIVLYFDHDHFAEETTFAVRDMQTQNIVYNGPRYIPERGERVKTFFSLLPGNYRFEVHDMDNDGISAPDNLGGDGDWKIVALYDGVSETQLAVSDKSFFGRKQTTNFTVGESTVVNVESSDLTKLEIESCWEQKGIEDVLGTLFGTKCSCDQNGQLLCMDANNKKCQHLNSSCDQTSECCSGRSCRAGYCRDITNISGGTRDDAKLGNDSVGGAAGHGRSGNLRHG
jgi:hypothetical protein